MDLLDEEEKGFSSGDSTEYPSYPLEGNDTSDSDEQNEEKQKLKRKRKAKPESWKKNLTKRLRNEGKQYINKNNKLVRERRLGPPCTEKCKLKCKTKLTNEERQDIFNEYYNLPDLQSKRKFVAFHMSAIIPAYQYKRGKRRNNNAFYFTNKEGARIRVCKSFFLSTLDLSDRFTRTVTEKTISNTEGIVTEDLRGKHGKQRRVDNNLKEGVKNFVKSIPMKDYVDGSKTIAEIHRDYVKKCEENGETSVNYMMFNRIFNEEFNIACYQPEMDQRVDFVAYSNPEENNSTQT
ncbi:unnamed protein product [Psylliodes chrysocephalus]|uniref:Uncharacterized protein n=1 Tax=Psylliodes chrysocephalus TaxID=3402493 RepID=A0A9P0GA71_9CUCU|nr:unnamed protein product [Psylliodes chrysocephala]